MALRRAIGAVKDKTSIGLARVGSSDSLSDLDVAIVRATSHDEYPADERYFREILSLTSYSRTFVGSCVNTLSRRLSKTKNWVVALKTLMLIQRLLTEGDPAYEQEFFFTTRRGTRMLNMSDFRDSRSNSWDFSAFVRMYALYLDEKLEYTMQAKKRVLNHQISRAYSFSYDQHQQEDRHQQEKHQDNTNALASSSPMPNTGLTFEQMLSKMHHLQQLLERFLATKPTGSARDNRIVIVALYNAVRESFQIYYDMTHILGILLDQFMELEIPNCIKVHKIFCPISKQFDELDSYYKWCKDIGVIRSSDCPEVEKITLKKLDLMDEFIRDKAANERNKLAIMGRREEEEPEEREPEIIEDMNTIKALPPAKGFPEEEEEEEEEVKQPEPQTKEEPEPKEADLLHLGDDMPNSDEHSDKLALALFNGEMGDASGSAPPLIWGVFNDTSDWATALVQSASYLPHHKASFGGGFDRLLLDGLYQHGDTNAALAANRVGGSGSASSVALGSIGNPQVLALPAPPSSSSEPMTSGNVDPFAASVGVAPPTFMQMSELENKQRRLVEEQLLWQQYQRDGMQGHAALSKMQQRPANMGSYSYGHSGYSYRY